MSSTPTLTAKQIALLELLDKGRPVVAVWSHFDLNRLESWHLVSRENAMSPNGRTHTSSIWSITPSGQNFLNVERKGL